MLRRPISSRPRSSGRVLTNQGQLCVARSRIIVHRSRHDELVSALEREAAGYIVGDPLDPATGFGPLAGMKQFERVSAYIAGAIEAGARMIAGGKTERHCGVAPTIFADVTEDMAVVREEIFGPVVTVQTFENTDEAIALASATSYGSGRDRMDRALSHDAGGVSQAEDRPCHDQRDRRRLRRAGAVPCRASRGATPASVAKPGSTACAATRR